MKCEGCTVCIEDRKNANNFVSLKGRDHFEDGELKRTVLEWICSKYYVAVLFGFIYLRIETNVGLL